MCRRLVGSEICIENRHRGRERGLWKKRPRKGNPGGEYNRTIGRG